MVPLASNSETTKPGLFQGIIASGIFSFTNKRESQLFFLSVCSRATRGEEKKREKFEKQK